MKLNDLFLHTKSKLRDNGVDAFADAEIIDCCSLAYEEVCKELGIFRKIVSLSPFEKRGNEQFYPKPSDMVSIVALKHNGQILPIKSFDSVHSVERFSDICGYTLHDAIVVVNGKENESIEVAYSYTKTINDLNESLELPTIALETLQNYTLYLLKRENRTDALQKASVYLQFYQHSLIGLKNAILSVKNSKKIVSTYRVV
ncbi:MAG: hypothetical protein K2N12_06290 [Helicobacter sp.]|nr:hypothetical protein [Helicobacter sp.]